MFVNSEVVCIPVYDEIFFRGTVNYDFIVRSKCYWMFLKFALSCVIMKLLFKYSWFICKRLFESSCVCLWRKLLNQKPWVLCIPVVGDVVCVRNFWSLVVVSIFHVVLSRVLDGSLIVFSVPYVAVVSGDGIVLVLNSWIFLVLAVTVLVSALL